MRLSARLALLAAGAAALGACTNGGEGVDAANGNAAAAPGTPGAAGRPFQVEVVGNFASPWAMTFLPGTQQALVTQREGRLMLWTRSANASAAVDVAGVPQVDAGGQGGLGDVIVHPQFARTRIVYLSWVEAGEGDTRGAVVGRARLSARGQPPRLEGLQVIWRQAPKVSGDGHFAHRIAFAPDGTIYLTSGDRQKMAPAQNRTSDLGKIIHLTAEGQRIGGRFHTLGHRNPLGLAFAPDGRLWSTEMGPQGGDELNLIIAGRNYGWPRASYGSHYGGGNIPDDHSGRGFEEPKTWWNPSVSPGGLLIYSGDLFKGWKGDALIPALSGEALIRVDLDGDAARKADHWPMGARIRAVDQGPRGELYLLEDRGRLLRLEPTA